MLTAPLWRLCISLSLPAVFGLVFVGAATFADAAFVGHFGGATALGAVLLAFPLTMFASTVSALVGSGAAAVLSRARGRGDDRAVADAYGAFASWSVLAGVAITIIGIAFARPLLHFVGARTEMLGVGTDYARIVMAGTVFGNFVFGVSFLIRGEGKIHASMVLLGGGSLLNVLLDAVFVGMLGWGSNGAAYATLATQVITASVTFAYCFRLAVPPRSWRLSAAFDLAPEMVRDGMAASLLYVVGIVQQSLVFRTCAQSGSADDLVFAGAYLRLLMVGLVPAWAVAMALAPVAGMSHGAGDQRRARRTMMVFGAAATGASVLVWAVAMFWPRMVLGALIAEPAILEAYEGSFRLLLWSFPTLGFQLVGAAYLSAVGRGRAAAAIIACRNVVVLGPLLWLLPSRLGTDGVWWALLIADMSSLVVALAVVGHKSAATKTVSAADS